MHPKSSDAAEVAWRLESGSGVGEGKGGGRELSIIVEGIERGEGKAGWRMQEMRKGQGKRKGVRLSQAQAPVSRNSRKSAGVSASPVISGFRDKAPEKVGRFPRQGKRSAPLKGQNLTNPPSRRKLILRQPIMGAPVEFRMQSDQPNQWSGWVEGLLGSTQPSLCSARSTQAAPHKMYSKKYKG